MMSHYACWAISLEEVVVLSLCHVSTCTVTFGPGRDEHTVTPKTVPMFGSFVLHMKWCV